MQAGLVVERHPVHHRRPGLMAIEVAAVRADPEAATNDFKGVHLLDRRNEGKAIRTALGEFRRTLDKLKTRP
jgi:hypothetical protein